MPAAQNKFAVYESEMGVEQSPKQLIKPQEYVSPTKFIRLESKNVYV